MSDRQRSRIEQSIHQLVAELLARRVKDPRVANVSITRVKISPDYAVARVFYNVIGGAGESADIAAGLASCRGFIRNRIKSHLRLRVIPELAFTYDASLDRAMKIEELIRDIHEEEAAEPDEDD